MMAVFLAGEAAMPITVRAKSEGGVCKGAAGDGRGRVGGGPAAADRRGGHAVKFAQEESPRTWRRRNVTACCEDSARAETAPGVMVTFSNAKRAACNSVRRVNT